MNKGYNLLNACAIYMNQPPIKPTVITAEVPSAGQIIALGGNATASDLVAEVKFDLPTPDGTVFSKLGIVGYTVTQRFEQNAVTGPYTLQINNYAEYGTNAPTDPVIYTKLSRNPQISPAGGANSVAEFIILNVYPGQTLIYSDNNNQYDLAQEQQQGYALPISFMGQQADPGADANVVRGAALIFKNQAAIPQTLTVTPIIASSDTLDDLRDMLADAIYNSNKSSIG